MKKLLSFSIAVLFAVGTTFAQGGGANATPEERAQRQTAQLNEAVKLDKTQEEKIYALNLDRAKQMQELRASAGGRPDREKMQEMQKSFEEKLKPILTAEQWTAYEKLREEQQSRMRNRQR